MGRFPASLYIARLSVCVHMTENRVGKQALCSTRAPKKSYNDETTASTTLRRKLVSPPKKPNTEPAPALELQFYKASTTSASGVVSRTTTDTDAKVLRRMHDFFVLKQDRPGARALPLQQCREVPTWPHRWRRPPPEEPCRPRYPVPHHEQMRCYKMEWMRFTSNTKGVSHTTDKKDYKPPTRRNTKTNTSTSMQYKYTQKNPTGVHRLVSSHFSQLYSLTTPVSK